MLSIINFFLFFTLVNLLSSSFANLVERLKSDIEKSSQKKGDIWVVLVAGSSGYYNYRHQADVLHAYQLIHKFNKIPKDRIITFLYDDIAYAEENPYKGNIINYPGGENLYTDDVVKDYTGDQVTPENFIGVLTRDQKLIDQNKKFLIQQVMILSLFTSDFFILFKSDHGAPSMISFPNKILTATKLKKTLDLMKEKKSFDKMLIYIEACESGSMFASDLNPKQNIYAITASSYNEPSYATFWDEVRKTYLADEFSINWLLDSYALDVNNQEETLFKQYLNVKNKTVDSHVSQFGDLQMAKRYDTSDFQGENKLDNKKPINIVKLESDLPIYLQNSVRSDEVEYHLTKVHSEINKDNSFERLLEGRKIMREFMDNLKDKFAKKLNLNSIQLTGRNKNFNLDCYDSLVNNLNENCIPLHVHTYLFRHLYLFVNACNQIKRQHNNISDLNQIILEQCDPFKRSFIQLPKVV